ncbi:MAG: hypothetical protein IKL04_00010, partial [Lachnospiraceae bacterium]|nr:hypothetical protein [Lachnospiraceae bacterium]
EPGSTHNDRIVFGEGILAESVEVYREESHLVLRYSESDKVTIQNVYSNWGNAYWVEEIEFADGTVWDISVIAEKAGTYRGTDGNDSFSGYGTMKGYHEDEVYHMGAGNDTVNAGDGNDRLNGGEGDDRLYGGAGRDLINGGVGNDTLDGGAGSDIYLFNPGDGADTISDYDTTENSVDTIAMGATADQLVFSQSGSDLLISVLGTADSVRVQNWYRGSAYQIENIQSADGWSLSNTQVDLLIQSMASFESTSGVTWSEAVAAGREEANTLVCQMWANRD